MNFLPSQSGLVQRPEYSRRARAARPGMTFCILFAKIMTESMSRRVAGLWRNGNTLLSEVRLVQSLLILYSQLLNKNSDIVLALFTANIACRYLGL